MLTLDKEEILEYLVEIGVSKLNIKNVKSAACYLFLRRENNTDIPEDLICVDNFIGAASRDLEIGELIANPYNRYTYFEVTESDPGVAIVELK